MIGRARFEALHPLSIARPAVVGFFNSELARSHPVVEQRR
jgi:hypothetical protein